MKMNEQDRQELVDLLTLEFNGKVDGGRKNLLLPTCPWCGHDGYKYGIRIAGSSGAKMFGGSHCFHCGRSASGLKQTLEALGHRELMPTDTTEYDEEMSVELDLFENEINDELVECKMPKGYKRTFKNRYLKSRGWKADDYTYFEVGTNRGMDWQFDDYIIIPVIENGIKVGYVGRKTWSKEDIEKYNRAHKRRILRYRNSTEREGNGFEKLIYNIDAVIPFVTDTVVLCEGVFDVVGLNRKLELYDNESVQAVATFGKKISDTQIYKLQARGVKTLIIGYDQDASDTIEKLSKELEEYFDIYIADIPQNWECKDWDEMSEWQVYEIFAKHLKSVVEYNLEGGL